MDDSQKDLARLIHLGSCVILGGVVAHRRDGTLTDADVRRAVEISSESMRLTTMAVSAAGDLIDQEESR